MRMLPTALAWRGLPDEVLRERISTVSAITHAHPRSQMACVLFAFVVRELMYGQPPPDALSLAQQTFSTIYEGNDELPQFRLLLSQGIGKAPESAISSDGYVLNTLTASLWCLLTTDNFSDCVLKAVNLGGDTDTTGCVAGGLAGVKYGVGTIPESWRTDLARSREIAAVFKRFASLADAHAQWEGHPGRIAIP